MGQVDTPESVGLTRVGVFLVFLFLAGATGWFILGSRRGASGESVGSALAQVIREFVGRTGPVEVPVLTFSEIVSWFVSNESQRNAGEDILAFTLSERTDDAGYRTVQGFFDKQSKRVIKGRVITSRAYDDELAERHQNNELVIYE